MNNRKKEMEVKDEKRKTVRKKAKTKKKKQSK